MIGDSLSHRWLNYKTAEGARMKNVTAVAVQSSYIFNITYDSLQSMPLPHGGRIIAYTDNALA